MLFKNVILDGEQTTYRIFENGTLMNEKTGKYYKGTIRNGYRWFDLRWKNKKYSRSQHKLLAEAFIENLDNLDCVHHKDGNRLNNSLENLEWVSYSENNLKVNKKPSNQPIAQNEARPDEEWRTFRNTTYMVSSYGRAKNAKTDKILKGKITTSGYREYCLLIDKKRVSLLAHRITYEAFHNEIPEIINHIDGNKLNNNIQNLENVSNKINTLKAIYDTKTLKFKKTACYDKEGNLVRVFMNNADAARAMNVRPQSIQAAIKKGYCSCGFYWKNLEE